MLGLIARAEDRVQDAIDALWPACARSTLRTRAPASNVGHTAAAAARLPRRRSSFRGRRRGRALQRDRRLRPGDGAHAQQRSAPARARGDGSPSRRCGRRLRRDLSHRRISSKGSYGEAIASTGAEPELVDTRTAPRSDSRRRTSAVLVGGPPLLRASLTRLRPPPVDGGAVTLTDLDGDGDSRSHRRRRPGGGRRGVAARAAQRPRDASPTSPRRGSDPATVAPAIAAQSPATTTTTAADDLLVLRRAAAQRSIASHRPRNSGRSRT